MKRILIVFSILISQPVLAFIDGDFVDGYTYLTFTSSTERHGWIYRLTDATSEAYPAVATLCEGEPIALAEIVHFENGQVVAAQQDWQLGTGFFTTFETTGHYFLRWKCVESDDYRSTIDQDAVPRPNWYFAWIAPPSEGGIE